MTTHHIEPFWVMGVLNVDDGLSLTHQPHLSG